jgi:hypothetical protein
MRISRLLLRDVQRHEDLDLRPAPGLTVIRGPNEAGKSTVQRGLELALFRRCTATGREIDGMRRWGAADDACPMIDLEFEVDGKAGRLAKRFAGAKGTVRLELDGQVITDPAAADRLLAELTGLPSEKFFRSTASVHHQELDELERDESALRDRLQLSMSGTDRGTSLAKKRLAEAIRRLTTEGPKNPGLLRRLGDETAHLATELSAGEGGLSRLEADQAALSQARERLASAEARVAEERRNLESADRAATLLGERDAARGRYATLKRAVELREEVQRREASHPSKVPVVVLRTGVERLRGHEQRISELRAELAEEGDFGVDIRELPPPWQPWAGVGIALTFAALVVAGAALNLGQQLAPVALGLLAAAVGATLVALRRLRKSHEITRRNLLHEGQIARRLRGRSEVAEELSKREQQRAEELRRIGLADASAAEALLTAEQEHVNRIEQLRAEERGLFGERGPEGDLAALRDAAAAEADQRAHVLTGMGAIGADPAAARERYRSAAAAASTEHQAAVAEEAAARARVEANQVDAEAVAAIAERLADARERLDASERRLRIYRTTLEALETAERSTMKKAARYLEEEMAEDIARITAGRYRRLKVDEASLAFSVWSAERGDWVDVRELSQGTLDQFYLAARVGLVRQLSQGRHPPLLLDDPFLTFDDERAATALVLLKGLAADHQVIYLTTSDRYDALADKVIELPRPTLLDESSPGAESA